MTQSPAPDSCSCFLTRVLTHASCGAAGEVRFPCLQDTDWECTSEAYAHDLLEKVLNVLKECDQDHNFLTYIFNHVVHANDKDLNQRVRDEMAKCFTTSRSAMAPLHNLEPNAMANMKAEMDMTWEAIKRECRFNKMGCTQDGLRRQIVVDDVEQEEKGSSQREAKDMVRVLTGSLPAQSTLANKAESSSGLHSSYGTRDQSFHADVECEVNSPCDKTVHPLWHSRHIITLQGVKEWTSIQAIPGSHNLMAAYPEDVGDVGSPWSVGALCKNLGLPGAGFSLPHIRIPLGPGYYIMFLGHFIHGGGACYHNDGSWRLHMYSEGKATFDPVDPQATCLLGPKCCAMAGIDEPYWGNATNSDAESITSGIAKRAEKQLADRQASLVQTHAPFAFL